MKKNVLIIAIALLTAFAAEAQKSKVVSAFNYLRNQELDKAKQAIDEASVNESSAPMAKTWLYKGDVYLQLYFTKDEAFKKLSENPLEVAYQSYLKCLELDTDKKFTKEANDKLATVAEQFFNQGVGQYKEEKYKEASKSFEFSGDLLNKSGLSDTLAIYYAGICAELDNNDETAQKHFNYLIGKDYHKATMYSSLSKIYTKQQDSVKAMEIIQTGLAKFPGNYDLLIAEANVYLAFGKTELAVKSLKNAITLNPNNPNLFYAMGAKYSELGMFKESEESYLKAIEIKPDYFDAYYNLGALYNNTAADILKEAASLPFGDPNYETKKAEGESLLAKAIPVLEKALELSATDKFTLLTLKQLYVKTNQLDKFKATEAKIKELGY